MAQEERPSQAFSTQHLKLLGVGLCTFRLGAPVTSLPIGCGALPGAGPAMRREGLANRVSEGLVSEHIKNDHNLVKTDIQVKNVDKGLEQTFLQQR